MEKTLALLRPRMRQLGIEIEQNHEKGLELTGYESELQQVLINIVHNACDALAEKKVTLPRIWISTASDSTKNQLVIRIGDNAGGIPENIISKVFESYFTTKEEQGTGIGLFLVQKIIKESFGGSVSVVNSEDGALFSIFLPNGTRK